ncbi:F-box protein GID2-like [Cryptomeria japonica]|uniref:F-box protein GID2-like n=1 Tax=Cryptomeria japonica TaxID=3369 RepID=UPI0027DA7F3B|nr:F-box protein GID2-like [Cryptomeria japonica]
MTINRGIVDNMDELHEIFKHLDAVSLAVASCVSRRWHQAAMEDNLWEMVCTKHWPASGISIVRLRSVVNVLGGFRRLYVQWVHPFLRHAIASSPCSETDLKKDNGFWSENQVQLSMSLFAIEYYGRLGS